MILHSKLLGGGVLFFSFTQQIADLKGFVTVPGVTINRFFHSYLGNLIIDVGRFDNRLITI